MSDPLGSMPGTTKRKEGKGREGKKGKGREEKGREGKGREGREGKIKEYCYRHVQFEKYIG
jgi:hypothetical protein